MLPQHLTGRILCRITHTHTHTHTLSIHTYVRIYIPTGNIGKELSVNPDLYISRDGGVSWERTLAGSWGVNVADHGGLLVAAMDYHQEPSTVLKYSCDEGYNWTDFTFIGVSLNTVEFRNPDTNGAEKSSEVSLFQRLKCMQEWYLGPQKVSCLEKCLQFKGVLIEVSHTIHTM